MSIPMTDRELDHNFERCRVMVNHGTQVPCLVATTLPNGTRLLADWHLVTTFGNVRTSKSQFGCFNSAEQSGKLCQVVVPQRGVLRGVAPTILPTATPLNECVTDSNSAQIRHFAAAALAFCLSSPGRRPNVRMANSTKSGHAPCPRLRFSFGSFFRS